MHTQHLQMYYAYMEDLINQFKEVTFHYLPRDKSRLADALATLASLVEIPEGKSVKPFRVGRRENPAYCCQIELEKVDDLWYSQIFQYLKYGEASFPTEEDGRLKEGLRAKCLQALKRLSAQYVILGDDYERLLPLYPIICVTIIPMSKALLRA